MCCHSSVGLHQLCLVGWFVITNSCVGVVIIVITQSSCGGRQELSFDLIWSKLKISCFATPLWNANCLTVLNNFSSTSSAQVVTIRVCYTFPECVWERLMFFSIGLAKYSSNQYWFIKCCIAMICELRHVMIIAEHFSMRLLC